MFRRYLPYLCIPLALSAAGCNDGPGSGRLAIVDRAEPGMVRVDTDALRNAVADEVADPPRTIYYNLTVHEWYDQGQPLRFDGAAYQAEGELHRVSNGQMRRVDTYRGVDVYVLAKATAPYSTVFVPVFPGYWQPFVRQMDMAPMHAD